MKIIILLFFDSLAILHIPLKFWKAGRFETMSIFLILESFLDSVEAWAPKRFSRQLKWKYYSNIIQIWNLLNFELVTSSVIFIHESRKIFSLIECPYFKNCESDQGSASGTGLILKSETGTGTQIWKIRDQGLGPGRIKKSRTGTLISGTTDSGTQLWGTVPCRPLSRIGSRTESGKLKNLNFYSDDPNLCITIPCF